MKKLAPDFSLQDQDGTMRRLSDYQGKWLVIFFYPNDRTLNCTREACKFRDEYRVIQQFGGAEVIGINKASVDVHKKFTLRHKLQFPVLSDPKHLVTQAFGAWRQGPVKWYGQAFGTRRHTYLIDPDGKIVKEYLNVDPTNHVMQVISDLQALQTS